MNEMLVGVYLVFGLLLRIGIPVVFTLALSWWLRKLDTKWREEARMVNQTQKSYYQQRQIPACWEYLHCTPERQASCPAFKRQTKPCWEIAQHNGHVPVRCQQCAYRQTVLAAIGD